MREGSKNGRAKLTRHQIEECRETWELFGGRLDSKKGKHNSHVVSFEKLAKAHGVAASTMRDAIIGRTWK